MDYNRFEALRAEQGITKKYIAEAINRTPTVCQDWKSGKSSPNEEQLKIVADILHTTVDYLQGYTDVKEKPTAGAAGMSAAEAGRYAIEHADSEDELWQLISRAQERIREMNGKK